MKGLPSVAVGADSCDDPYIAEADLDDRFKATTEFDRTDGVVGKTTVVTRGNPFLLDTISGVFPTSIASKPRRHVDESRRKNMSDTIRCRIVAPILAQSRSCESLAKQVGIFTYSHVAFTAFIAVLARDCDVFRI